MSDALTSPKPDRTPLSRLVPKLLLTTAYFWVPTLIFLALADDIRGGRPLYGDVSILQGIHHLSGPLQDRLAVAITTLGSAPAVVLGVAVAAAILLYKRYRGQALFLLFCAGGTAVLNVVFKLLFHRQRPTLWHQIVTENGYSFPSGHAMISSALAFSVIILCWNTRYRWLVAGVAFAYFISVGLSRLYLGVHYPSDVIAGWCVSLLWVVTVRKVFESYSRRRAPAIDGRPASSDT